MTNPIYQRMQMLTGTPALQRLHKSKVAIFGVGGVGSWAAEALVRSGILDLTLVDNDVVCVTNVNRQLQATTRNIGQAKVSELKARLLTLNPHCNIAAIQKAYDPNTPQEFQLDSFDYVLDCIDSISCKVDLIIRTTAAGPRLYSALGAAGKLDPTQIKIASIWNTQGHCPLARLIRRKLRAAHFGGDFKAVFSTETTTQQESTNVACNTDKRINGSAVHITATFGMFLSGLIIQDVIASGPELPTV